MEVTDRPLVEWAVAEKALPGEPESGDRYLVKPLPNAVLVAVADGLGHGVEAGAAAGIALATLERHAHEPVVSLLKYCHDSLTGTRGVVMSLARVDGLEGTMTWLGVGNVEGVLLRADAASGPARESLLLGRGVVGGSLPPLRAFLVPVRRGDTLILATDGLRSGFAEGVSPGDGPRQLADRILATHRRGTDDALVLVARYAGAGP
jgi:negative regulator of sigma-B (phosphoserine phosphatase)